VPWGITTGPDGALWFTEEQGNKIGRITTTGTTTEYPMPMAGTYPTAITAGPDGALWFTVAGDGIGLGRITTSGNITQYSAQYGSGITMGPDGALWYTTGSGIGRITSAGITYYSVPANNQYPYWITAGPDGALWFTNNESCTIGRMTTGGAVTNYNLPPFSVGAGITLGPDGALWVAGTFDGIETYTVTRITTAGVLTAYPLPNGSSGGDGITVGPDGALWVTGIAPPFREGFAVVRVTTDGKVTQYPIFTGGLFRYYTSTITVGPDGALWFTVPEANSIVQMVIGPPNTTKPTSHMSALPSTESVANFTVQWAGTDSGGPGVKNYSIYVSDNGGAFTPWLPLTPVTQAIYSGVLGHTYGFYSIAQDFIGNQENPKSAAEATTTVIAAPGDVNGDGAVNCLDLDAVKAAFGTSRGQPGYNAAADLNHDGVVNVLDLAIVARYLPPALQCQ
jgi:virginiamycin B lyase